MDIAAYLDEVIAKFATGQATEHSYRAPLERLFESIDDTLTIINEPKRSDAGMPDFIFQRKDVPVGWVEAKDVDKDVISLKGYSKDQRKRYEAAFPNLIYTNGVDFEFIRDGEQVHFVSIADFMMGLQPKPENFGQLERQLRLFAETQPISIRSAAKLANIMAAKAAIIKDEIGLALADDPEFRSGLGGQFRSFKQNLLPNLTPGEFADIYAETITYGMFAARYHDDKLETFSRAEALEKLPSSNPFLKGLFEYIAGPQLPSRLKYIVDDLATVMRAADPHALFEKYGQFTARNDPFIHFYEDFLAAYNPKKRKSRGVWYTPEPVVDFIVRAVDDVLKNEFGLPDGLADTSKVTVDWDTGQDDPKTGKPRTIKKEVHKVQILDPATGTGTFLAKAVQLISDRVKKRGSGLWNNYVEKDLLPRLHGFELLMASYAMCHMKLDMQLTESGYTPSDNPPRLSVWLTNSLEPAEREVRDLFFQPLAEEARGASEVKRQMPIMCVIGNPPYSVSSRNRSPFIEGLVSDYKKGLNERNIQPLSDDYIKFIRLAHSYIEENGRGVVGFITNNSYIDGVIHRRMRAELAKKFDKIIVVDLHGSSNKGERAPDGGPDQNVFDIKQGVALLLLVKTTASDDTAKVFKSDAHGPREKKYTQLHEGLNGSLAGRPIELISPYYLFQPFGREFNEYDRSGFSIAKLFQESLSGVVSGNDKRFVGFEKSDIVGQECNKHRFLLRPLDHRVINYDVERLQRARWEIMRHMVSGPNIALISPRQGYEMGGASITDCISGHKTFSAYNRNYIYPLYLYPDETAEQTDALALTERTPNLDPKLFAKICRAVGIDPGDTAGPDDDFRAPTGNARTSEVKVFDYIYGALHSPDYRETFAEFLKIDFPRVPYPTSPEVFLHVSEKGEQLRRLHLMETAAIAEAPYAFEGKGDGSVAAKHPKYEGGKVYINPGQYFEDVPQAAWDFPIGGYQPAQKWLNDRKDRILSYEDIGHYQKILKILLETDRIMKEIELPLGIK